MNKKRKKPSAKTTIAKRKAYNYAVRILAEADGITYRQAQLKYRRAQLDVVIRRANIQTQDEWLQINPRTYFKIKKGQRAYLENTEGPARTAAYVEGVRQKHIYWNTVKLLAGVLEITPRQAQAYINQQRREIRAKTGFTGARLKSALEWTIWIDLGVYREGSPRLK